MEEYKKYVLEIYKISSKCLEFIVSINFISLSKILPLYVKEIKRSGSPLSLISDSKLFDIIKDIDSENDRNFILGMINKKEIRKRDNYLKRGDSDSFFENINRNKLEQVKILVSLKEILKRHVSIQKGTIYEFESKEKPNLDKYVKMLDGINEEFSVDSIYDSSKETKQLYIENVIKLELAANDEEKLNLILNNSFLMLVVLFRFVDICVSPNKAGSFWGILSESDYAPDFQELHNQYKSVHLYANDWVICKDNYKQIKRSLPIGFDEQKDDPYNRECLHTGLKKTQIEYLYRELISSGYILEGTDIERFAFFLTGKPKEYDNFEKMKWLGQQLELGCFIGLLYKGQGRWVATENAFASEKGLDSKGLASSLGKIESRIKAAKEKNEEYKHESYEFFKKIIEGMKNIS